MPHHAVSVALDRPDAPDVRGLLEEHLADMFATSPAESVHALDPSALSDPAITFWTARDGDGVLLGCGALRDRGERAGEIKSMRTTASARGRGVATALLDAIVDEAWSREFQTLWLETGAEDFFAPARRLYGRAGFVECGPFGSYGEDPNSVFMTLDLARAHTQPPVRATGSGLSTP
jgi:putative acetyltransferase